MAWRGSAHSLPFSLRFISVSLPLSLSFETGLIASLNCAAMHTFASDDDVCKFIRDPRLLLLRDLRCTIGEEVEAVDRSLYLTIEERIREKEGGVCMIKVVDKPPLSHG